MNIFRPDPEKTFPHWVKKEIPVYKIDEASDIAKKYLNEDPERAEGWEKTGVNYEGIDSSWTKPIVVNQNEEMIYVSKASAYIAATVKQIFDCIWDPRGEMIWNTQTVQKIDIVHDDFSNQLVHQQLKKVPAINLQNDLLIRRAFLESHKSTWIYYVSEKGKPDPAPTYTRGLLLFGGILIEAVDARRCRVSFVWSFDINKKLSVKYKDEECKKVALRLCKLKKKIEDDLRLAARAKEYEAQKNVGFDVSEN